MERIDLRQGDPAWVHLGDHQGKLTAGKVLAVLQLEGYSFQHYVIAVPTPVDDLLIIRAPWAVSDAEDKPIGMWRRSA